MKKEKSYLFVSEKNNDGFSLVFAAFVFMIGIEIVALINAKDLYIWDSCRDWSCFKKYWKVKYEGIITAIDEHTIYSGSQYGTGNTEKYKKYSYVISSPVKKSQTEVCYLPEESSDNEKYKIEEKVPVAACRKFFSNGEHLKIEKMLSAPVKIDKNYFACIGIHYLTALVVPFILLFCGKTEKRKTLALFSWLFCDVFITFIFLIFLTGNYLWLTLFLFFLILTLNIFYLRLCYIKFFKTI